MKTVCAWCRKEMGARNSPEAPQEEISHSICQDCLSNIRFQAGGSLSDYLETLPWPVLVVDADAVVQDANRAARGLIKKPIEQIRGRLGGDVFECAYARLPEGCGRTIHCSGCTIRRTVTNTLATGRPRLKVPAVLRQGDPDDPDQVQLYISTQKVDGLVFLTIETVSQRR